MNDLGLNRVFMVGAGGHASVLMDILKQNNIIVSGVFAPNIDMRRLVFSSIPYSVNEDG